MSIYGPKIRLPKISLPHPHLPKLNKKKVMPIVMIVAVIILIGLVFMVADLDFGSSTKISWKNNPLDLKDDVTQYAELELNLTNTLKETTDINLEVTSESNEIIIFCPDKIFPNVSTGNQRQTTCIVRRNSNEKVFSGNYTINIKTNIEETKTFIEIRTK